MTQTFTVVTTWGQQHWEHHAKRSVQSILDLWPEQVHKIFYPDDESQTITANNTSYYQLPDQQSAFVEFKTRASIDPIVKEKMVAANSSQTVRSRSRTGKHSRQLVTPWTQAWEAESAPEPLPMPLQPMVAEPALQKVNKLAAGGHDGAKELATYWVGQGVGLMNQSISASDVVQEFKEDFVGAYERLNNFVS